MQSQYSDTDIERAILTLDNITETITQLVEWNQDISCVETFYESQSGMQLLAANCTLITAIGEGINRVNRILPGYLANNFSEIPWHAIIGMRNHIAHGYFELDADVVFEAVKKDIPPLQNAITDVINRLRSSVNL